MGWTKRIALVAALGLGILCLGVTASHADGWHGEGGGWHGHGGGWHGGYWGRWGYWGGPRIAVGVGPLGFGTGFWWGAPYGYGYPYPYPYYAAPPTVVVQPPPVYIQRPAPPTGYWYYCPSARGYYPAVPSCPEPWVKVPPRGE